MSALLRRHTILVLERISHMNTVGLANTNTVALHFKSNPPTSKAYNTHCIRAPIKKYRISLKRQLDNNNTTQ